ncbi:LytTR family DNA-binding domain-containing protein [Bacteroides sp.]|uniref:LytTR family DNA-binding domain-containing protein n=1 Tax=Bacteroides sp. TaxID=29523 RepID=UPI00345B48C4
MKHKGLLFTNEGILLSESLKIRTITYKDIAYFITDRPYVVIGTNKNERIYIQISMSLIAKYVPSCFCICSQSAIINLFYVDAYEEHQQTFRVCLRNACIVKVSRRYHNSLRIQILLFKKTNEILVNES